ncbi:thiamine phosphate synthase [Rhizobium sp. LCM 4573]|uniref:thiamine phosphate synthase n=1 Tax=Rhizobium sp. LCM 4573 TaxID=1848291 RepID=UPI0008D977A7|nr:thiamine phosphate synthase [Rhizobium sp. LCM 4573]OHV82275.1 thiamine-phosphate diphosphorylase [Rhizobium sp. LCM 4573]
MKKSFDLSLYLVLDPDLCQAIGMVETARLAVSGGVTMVQLRDKQADTGRMIDTGQALKVALAGTGVPLIVNDDVEAAIAIGAEGLHVGQDDISAEAARALIGPDMILGLSVQTGENAVPADAAFADYAGIGPIFPTSTKPEHAPAIGFDGLRKLVGISPIPTVAIGGVKAEHVAPALAAGADGVAVVSAICGQPNPKAAAERLMLEIQKARQ